jgi:hypothetical protein
MRLNLFFALLLLLSLGSCRNNPIKCKYKPTAIFAPTMPQVRAHHFELKADVGIEEVLLADGSSVNVLQKVCNSTMQMFQFTMPGNFRQQDNAFWIAQAQAQLRHLSSVDPSLAAFGQWADALQSVASTIHVGERTAVQPNIYVKIDRILSDNAASLLIELSQP